MSYNEIGAIKVHEHKYLQKFLGNQIFSYELGNI